MKLQHYAALAIALTLAMVAVQSAIGQGAALPGAAAAPEIPALRVAVTQISENRSTQGSGSINLQLAITGEGLPPVAVVRQVTVTKAVDNTDRPLQIMAGRGMSPMSLTSQLSSGMMPSGPLRGTAAIGSAPRTSTSVKFVEGSIEIFMPSEATESIIRIPNIKNHPGRIEHPVLAKHGIHFVFMADRASTEAGQALMANVGRGGATGASTDGVAGYGYVYSDPSARFAGAAVVMASGGSMRGGGGGSTSTNWGSRTFTLQGPMPDDAQLVIYLAVPEAITTVPFRVEDIALP